MRYLIALLSGLVFGLGLIVSGMTDPAKVKGFLDLFGAWDLSLALVMGGAIAVGLIAFARAKHQPRSWTGDPIELPSAHSLNARLMLGGPMFGAGWGGCRLLSGPAVFAASAGSTSVIAFVVAMLVGESLYDLATGLSRRPGTP